MDSQLLLLTCDDDEPAVDAVVGSSSSEDNSDNEILVGLLELKQKTVKKARVSRVTIKKYCENVGLICCHVTWR